MENRIRREEKNGGMGEKRGRNTTATGVRHNLLRHSKSLIILIPLVDGSLTSKESCVGVASVAYTPTPFKCCTSRAVHALKGYSPDLCIPHRMFLVSRFLLAVHNEDSGAMPERRRSSRTLLEFAATTAACREYSAASARFSRQTYRAQSRAPEPLSRRRRRHAFGRTSERVIAGRRMSVLVVGRLSAAAALLRSWRHGAGSL